MTMMKVTSTHIYIATVHKNASAQSVNFESRAVVTVCEHVEMRACQTRDDRLGGAGEANETD